MATRKRNEYLEAEESQSEESGYDSEAGEESRNRQTTKRRKTSYSGEVGEQSDDDLKTADEDEIGIRRRSLQPAANPGSQHSPSHTKETADHQTGSQKAPRTRDRIEGEEYAAHPEPKKKPKSKPKSGVVYLSRIPPFMKPSTVKHFLEPYGEITRIFLTPEDPKSHTARVRHGGNKKRSFVDGWVEFLHKRDAKLVAETLNANIIGGKKGGYYHDDVWNMRYLRGFKWKDLTEQIKNENAERASRLRMEIAQTTRENKRFVENVERGKMLERIEGKRKKRNENDDKTGAKALIVRESRSSTSFTAQSPPSRNQSQKNEKTQSTEVKQVLDMVL